VAQAARVAHLLAPLAAPAVGRAVLQLVQVAVCGTARHGPAELHALRMTPSAAAAS
jgi:hypothetical protein